MACPCCGGRYRKFLAYGRPRRNGARCPGCGSLERHRAIWLYLTQVVGVLDGPHRVLDVAPAPFISAGFQRATEIDYLSVDLESPLAMSRMDVTNLDLPDQAFDVVLCSHVLEHVPDDRAAMRELARVLRPDGTAILQTPWDPDLAVTDEDPSITDVAEREQRFGQSDHIRMYGRDLLDRLAEAGWRVSLVDPVATFGPDGVRRHGLAADDLLIIGRRQG